MKLSPRLFPYLLACVLASAPLARPAVAQGVDQKDSRSFKTAPTPIDAPAYFLMDVNSGRVLAQKNAHARMFPASTTKMMTCLLACESGKLDQIIRVGKHPSETGESGIGLLPGERLTLADLVRAALIKSANDACVAIAEGIAGSQPKFVAMMNARAKALGCHDTHFANPHGLHSPDHYTSAHDLAVIGRAALKQDFINEIVRTKTATIPGNWKVGPQRILINRNKLLWRWDECDGIKTGYTKQAGNCLVATATHIDPVTRVRWRLLSVVMLTHGGQSWPESESLMQEQGFKLFHPKTVTSATEILEQGAVQGASFRVEAVPAKDVVLPLRGQESETLTHKAHIFHLLAPVEKGDVVGHVEYFAGVDGQNRKIADLPLVARDLVPQSMWSKTIPGFGGGLSRRSFVARILVLGVFSLIVALVLKSFQSKSHGRRQKPHTFEPARLRPASSREHRDSGRGSDQEGGPQAVQKADHAGNGVRHFHDRDDGGGSGPATPRRNGDRVGMGGDVRRGPAVDDSRGGRGRTRLDTVDRQIHPEEDEFRR